MTSECDWSSGRDFLVQSRGLRPTWGLLRAGLWLCRSAVCVSAGIAFVFALAVATGKPAQAETFVCRDGTLLTVAPEDIARMQRTNACVAEAYGLSLPAPAAAVSAQVMAEIPLPARRPSRRTQTAAIAAAEASANGARKPPEQTGSIAARKPDEVGTYRRVLILNARPGQSRFFNHTR